MGVVLIRQSISMKLLLILALIAFVASGLGFYFTMGLRQDVQNLQQQIEAEQARQQVLARVVQRRPTAEANVEEATSRLDAVQGQVIRQEDMGLVTTFGQQLATLYHVRDLQINYRPSQRLARVTRVPVSVRGWGSFVEVLAFAQALDLGVPFFSVDTVNMEITEARTVVLNMSGYAYVLPSETSFDGFWQPPEMTLDATDLDDSRWGLPLSVLENVFGRGIQLLGIVRSERGSRALVSVAGEKIWVREGDVVALVEVVAIESSRIIVDLGGMEFSVLIQDGGQVQ